jgi:hypothetical protein
MRAKSRVVHVVHMKWNATGWAGRVPALQPMTAERLFHDAAAALATHVLYPSTCNYWYAVDHVDNGCRLRYLHRL